MNEIVTKLLASTAAVALTAYSFAASAQSPQGATVAAGSIAVTRQGATTVITQGTEKGIIDWRSFSIGAQEAVRFDQPGRSSVTLNRVTSAEISRIDGNLSATGQVWIANPNGVMIGSGGQVNVGGLLATTGRVDAAEFLRSGRASIDQISKDAAIVNQGTVNIQAGGYAALAAAAIRNDGVIAARSGSVAMGSGKAMTVDFAGDKLITFQVTQPLDQAPSGADALISGSGTVKAEGGVVVMSARAAKGVMDSVINLKGHVVATSVKVDGGTVSFGDGGIVQVSGKIDASDATGQGGTVSVLGEKVGLTDGASIDASGAAGGGTVLVGGDWQGKGAIGAMGQNAQIAYVAPTASINADATVNGTGGKVVVWADDTTRVNGSISARGGVAGGDGGQVETSGKRSLTVGTTSKVTTVNRTASAKAGSWLLDPNDITINNSQNNVTLTSNVYAATADAASSIDVATLASDLNSNNITIQTTTGFGTGNGDITFGGYTLSYTGASVRTLTLKADRNIDFQTGSHIVATNNSLNVTLEANAFGSSTGAVKIDGTITTHGGSINVGGPSNGSGKGGAGGLLTGVSINAAGRLNAAGGDIVINGLGDVDAHGVVIAGQLTTAGNANITILGNSPSASASVSHGVVVSGSVLNAGTGTIGITGKSLNTTTGSNGILVSGTVANTGASTALGAITLTGTRGQGGGINIVVAGGTLYTGSGNLVLDGVYSGGGGAGSSHGVSFGAATLSTTNGTIQVTGAGSTSGGAGNHGIAIGTSTSITASGTGDVRLTGTRGEGAGSYNVQVQGGSSTNLTSITTATGTLSIDGSASTIVGPYASVDGVYADFANIVTNNGVILITGKSGLNSTSANGVSIYRSTISNIGSSTTLGQIKLSGDLNGATGADIYFETATLTGANRSLIVEGDAFGVGPGVTSFTTSSTGKTVYQPRTGGTAIAVDGNSSAGTLGLLNMISLTNGSIEIGSAATGTITTAGAFTISKDFAFVSGSSPIIFNSTVDDSTSTHTLKTSTSGTVTFGANVGGISALGAVAFSGTVAPSADNSYSFTVGSAGTSSFGGGLGTGLKRFTTVNVGGPVSASGTFYSVGSQSYAGAVILSGSGMSISASTLASFGGTINSISSGALKGLSVNAGTASFVGAVGGSTVLSNFSVTVINTALVLPTLTVQNMGLSTGTGAITQGGGTTATVSNQTSISGIGAVTIANTGNDFNTISVSTIGAVSIKDANSLNILGISTSGSLGLSAPNLGQSGIISAQSLSLSNVDVAVLNTLNNTIGTLSGSMSGSSQILLLRTADPGGLTIGAVTGKIVNVTQTGTGGMTLNGVVTANTSADLFASAGTLSFTGGGALYTPTASMGGGAISAGGAAAISITNAPLTLYGSSGTLGQVTVNGSTNPVTAGYVTLSTTGGSMLVNGATLNGPAAQQPQTPVTTASVATQASVAPVVSVPSVASVATVASIASFPSTPSVASVATVSTQPTQALITLLTELQNTGGNSSSILNQILAPVVKFDLAPLIFAQVPPPPPPTQAGPNPSAQSLVSIVTSTPPGAFIPQGPSVVGGTGATLASAPTIKVDLADSGGGNGQVIAFGVSPEIGGPGGPGAGGGGGGGGSGPSVLPGLLRDNRGGGRRVERVEPPLAQQPSQMNEEPFLD